MIQCPAAIYGDGVRISDGFTDRTSQCSSSEEAAETTNGNCSCANVDDAVAGEVAVVTIVDQRVNNLSAAVGRIKSYVCTTFNLNRVLLVYCCHQGFCGGINSDLCRSDEGLTHHTIGSES